MGGRIALVKVGIRLTIYIEIETIWMVVLLKDYIVETPQTYFGD